jgi:hypothetical protein
MNLKDIIVGKIYLFHNLYDNSWELFKVRLLLPDANRIEGNIISREGSPNVFVGYSDLKFCPDEMLEILEMRKSGLHTFSKEDIQNMIIDFHLEVNKLKCKKRLLRKRTSSKGV